MPLLLERTFACRTPPSVGAGIPWVAHPISKCDTCTLFDHHTSGLYNKDTCHNVTIPPASSCCIPGFTCVQTWWSRTLGALIHRMVVMQALDQVRSLSDSVQKLANDTVLALGNIQGHSCLAQMMILQNRVAWITFFEHKGEPCTVIGPECCTGLMDPTENLNKIQQDILGLSENYTR